MVLFLVTLTLILQSRINGFKTFNGVNWLKLILSNNKLDSHRFFSKSGAIQDAMLFVYYKLQFIIIDESSSIESSQPTMELDGIYKSTSLILSMLCWSVKAVGEPIDFLQFAISFGGVFRISIGLLLIQLIYYLPTSIWSTTFSANTVTSLGIKVRNLPTAAQLIKVLPSDIENCAIIASLVEGLIWKICRIIFYWKKSLPRDWELTIR